MDTCVRLVAFFAGLEGWFEALEVALNRREKKLTNEKMITKEVKNKNG